MEGAYPKYSPRLCKYNKIDLESKRHSFTDLYGPQFNLLYKPSPQTHGYWTLEIGAIYPLDAPPQKNDAFGLNWWYKVGPQKLSYKWASKPV